MTKRFIVWLSKLLASKTLIEVHCVACPLLSSYDPSDHERSSVMVSKPSAEPPSVRENSRELYESFVPLHDVFRPECPREVVVKGTRVTDNNTNLDELW